MSYACPVTYECIIEFVPFGHKESTLILGGRSAPQTPAVGFCTAKTGLRPRKML